MLVCVWEAMDAAIVQLTAEEWMAQYTVAVVSSPYADKDSRENIIDTWRKLISGTWQSVTRPLAAGRPGGDIPLREVIAHVRGAFGRAIRD